MGLDENMNYQDNTVRANSPRLKKRLYTISETAEYLGRTVWSVRELIWKGELPAVRVGRRIHLDIYDLDEFIEKNKMRELF